MKWLMIFFFITGEGKTMILMNNSKLVLKFDSKIIV